MSDYRAIVIGENFAESASFSGGSWSGSFPLSNSQTRDLGVVSRSTNATTTSTKIRIDLGREEQIGGVALCCINWQLTAQARVFFSNFGDYSNLIYDTGLQNVPGFICDPSLVPAGHADADDGILRRWIPDELDRHFCHVVPEADASDAFARYVGIDISDATNPAGYLQHAYAMVGAGFRPSINYGDGNGLGLEHVTDLSFSLGHQLSSWERGDYRTWAAGFRYLTEAELYGSAFRMKLKARDSRPVFVVPNPADALNFQIRSFLARMREMSKIEQLAGTVDRGAVNFVFEEWS